MSSQRSMLPKDDRGENRASIVRHNSQSCLLRVTPFSCLNCGVSGGLFARLASGKLGVHKARERRKVVQSLDRELLILRLNVEI
jgi:hypothetical protein